VKEVKRCGHGFTKFEHYRLRVLLPPRCPLKRVEPASPVEEEVSMNPVTVEGPRFKRTWLGRDPCRARRGRSRRRLVACWTAKEKINPAVLSRFTTAFEDLSCTTRS